MTKTETKWQLHTPRCEWRLHGTGSFAEIREDGIAIAFPAFCSDDALSDNRLALMAAAPDLLATLRAIANDCEDFLSDDLDMDAGDMCQAFLSAINDAISKAS